MVKKKRETIPWEAKRTPNRRSFTVRFRAARRKPPPQLSGAVLSLPPGAGRDHRCGWRTGAGIASLRTGESDLQRKKNRESPPEKEISGFCTFNGVSKQGGSEAAVPWSDE